MARINGPPEPVGGKRSNPMNHGRLLDGLVALGLAGEAKKGIDPQFSHSTGGRRTEQSETPHLASTLCSLLDENARRLNGEATIHYKVPGNAIWDRNTSKVRSADARNGLQSAACGFGAQVATAP